MRAEAPIGAIIGVANPVKIRYKNSEKQTWIPAAQTAPIGAGPRNDGKGYFCQSRDIKTLIRPHGKELVALLLSHYLVGKNSFLFDFPPENRYVKVTNSHWLVQNWGRPIPCYLAEFDWSVAAYFEGWKKKQV